MSFAGDNTTTVKEKWTCFADVIQVHPIWHPSFVPDAPSPTQLTVVWCHRGFGQWLFPDECCSKQGTFSMRSRRRMWCESMLRLDGFFVMAMRVSVISEKIYAMHSILFVFLIETVPTQCYNQWTHGRGRAGNAQYLAKFARCDELRAPSHYPKFLKAAYLEEVHGQQLDVTVYCPQVGLCSSYAAWHRWSNIRVSASCLQGDKAARSVGLLLRAVSPFVVRRR